MVNKEWIDGFNRSYSVFELGGCSDHMRYRLYIKEIIARIVKPFKFVNVSSKSPIFLPTVSSTWEESKPFYQSTSTIHRLTKKIKALKPRLRVLGKQVISDITKKTRETYKLLCYAQKATMLSPTPINVEKEGDLDERWMRLADIKERYLQQKSNLHWLKVGDKNKKVFHNAVKLREMRNSIREIKCTDGRLVTDQMSIKEEVERHFREFVSTRPAMLEVWPEDELRELLEFRCHEVDRLMLVSEVTKEDISKVIFSMSGNKSPSPDGFFLVTKVLMVLLLSFSRNHGR